MSNALEWLKRASRLEEWEDGELFDDFLAPHGASVGWTSPPVVGGFVFEVVDVCFKRLEGEDVWSVVKELNSGKFFKITGQFTSWDGVDYRITPTEKTEVLTTVWS